MKFIYRIGFFLCCILLGIVIAHRASRPIAYPLPGPGFDESEMTPKIDRMVQSELKDEFAIQSKQNEQLANPAASQNAIAVYHYLSGLKNRKANKILSGQNLGHGTEVPRGYTEFVTRLAETVRGGHRPAILGADYGWNKIEDGGIEETNRTLIHHWNQGGLVTLHSHLGSPFFEDGTVQDARKDCNLMKLLDPDSDVHRRWMQQLNATATGLNQLQEAGVVVLWRPFHEMNGGWFWWCPSDNTGEWAKKEDFVAIWQFMFEYFTESKKLNNLIWVYSPNAQLDEKIKPTDYYYPGDDWVDVVGIDLYYWSELNEDVLDQNESLSLLRRFGKPIALCEVGPGGTLRDGTFDNASLIQSIRNRHSDLCYFCFWSSWTADAFVVTKKQHVAIVDNRNADRLLGDPWVVNRNQVRIQK